MEKISDGSTGKLIRNSTSLDLKNVDNAVIELLINRRNKKIKKE